MVAEIQSIKNEKRIVTSHMLFSSLARFIGGAKDKVAFLSGTQNGHDAGKL